MKVSAGDVLLWGALPYVVLAVFVVGTVWRYRYDKFGWTTRSSELYESKLLHVASPLFHYGLIFVFLGHLIGLLIPESWTNAVGYDEDVYHAVAVLTGGIAGLATLAGVALLVYRRRRTGPVFLATTRNDKLMYLVLTAALVAGLTATTVNAVWLDHDYRQDLSPWFRGLISLNPHADQMAAVPAVFKVHVLIAFALFALFPFTRLVHALSAPLFYLFRPYVVYRSRDPRSLGPRAPRRGWERV